MPRFLTVFLCAAGGILLVAILKALLVSGLDRLPDRKVLVFASSTFGFVAALIDWGFLRDLLPVRRLKPALSNSVPVDLARMRPIVFREICSTSTYKGLSFYGGLPIGSSNLVWPRVCNKPGKAPLSFVMQWDLAELSKQDATGLLPGEGALYLFADLGWGEPFDFQFIHRPGPVKGWQEVAAPDGLPPVYGNEGAYQVPYCSAQIQKEKQTVPCLLPKWPFSPLAFAYPEPMRDDEEGGELFWHDGDAAAEALVRIEHPEGVPEAKRLDEKPSRFERPFAGFPHDYAAVRVVAAKLLHELRHPEALRREDLKESFGRWKREATEQYLIAAEHEPGAAVEASQADEMWSWMEGLEPVLGTGWDKVVEDCVNVSLGLGSEGAGMIPPELVGICERRHRLATAYVRDEYPDHGKPDSWKKWEARKAEGSLQEIRVLHAPCPNHMFGPPSYVQGYVEEYLQDWILLLELSSRTQIGHEFGEGVLQFLIQPADLRAGRFDRVKLVASAY